MIAEVIAGALANVVSDVLSEMARRLGIARRAAVERRHSADLELATYFDTYKFEQQVSPELVRRLLAATEPVDADTLLRKLATDRCHAVLHELIAVRLTDAPEQQLDRLRRSFRHAFWPLGGLDHESAREIADAAFEYFDDELSEVVAQIEGAAPATVDKLRERAIGHRIVAILDAIERHEAALSDEGDHHEADQLFLARYRRHIVEEFGMLAPPDLQQRRRIPIGDLYVPPAIAPIPVEPEIRETQSPSLALAQFATSLDRTVLLGDPGAGKTTAARALIHAHARDAAAATPFLVTLRDFTADGVITRSVVEYIEHEMEVVYQCAPPRGWLRRQLLDGAALVVFDGLDELVDTTRRSHISTVIEHFCIEYPLARVLVTSRFVGYRQASLDERAFIKYRIDRFDDEQVAEYARKWFASDRTLKADQAAKDCAAFVAESVSVPDLRSNPLMLSLMCVLYRGEGYIPQHRAQVYRMCADLLFHRWDASRHIHVALSLSQAQVQRLLRALAHWLLTRDDTSTAVTERQLIAKTTELLLDRDVERAQQAEAAAVQFVAFCHGRGWIFVDVGTTAAGEPLYAFAHRTFLEYFAAAHLAFHADTPEQLAWALAPRLDNGEWDVIAQLAIAMKDESTARGGQRTLQALLEERGFGSNRGRGLLLLTAASCLDALDLTPDYVKAFTRRVLDYLLATEARFETRDSVLAMRDAVLIRLRSNGSRWRDLMAAEFTARAEILISSGDAYTRSVGFYLATSFDSVVTEVKLDSASRSFWANWARSNAVNWREAIERDAAIELTTLKLALKQGFLSVREVLAQPKGFTCLATSVQNPLFGYYDASFLGAYGNEFRLRPALKQPAFGACLDLGDYLLNDKPQPPFVDTLPWFRSAPDSYAGRVLPPGERVDESVYLAVAVLTASEIESRMRTESPTFIAAMLSTNDDGWLSALVPYIRVRLGAGIKVRTPLAPLPMRVDYQELFRAWAYREVNFTRLASKEASE